MEGAALTVQLLTGTSKGTLVLNGDGSFSYRPTTGFTGNDSFTYITNDGTQSSNAATVTIAVLPALVSVDISPAGVIGGSPSQGTVTLSGPAPQGGAVILLSDDSSSASIPTSVTVPAGAKTAGFTIVTTSVATTRSVTVSAVYAGATKTALLTITAAPSAGLASISVSPGSVKGGSSSRGTVTLTKPAPTGGAVVYLSDNSAAVGEPASITVPAGSRVASFTITTRRVFQTTSVTIYAQYNAVTRSTILTLTRG